MYECEAVGSQVFIIAVLISSPLSILGNDYDVLSIVLTFSSGQSVGVVQTTSVDILNDSNVENDEVFTVSINSMDPGFMRGISTAWVTIIEDSSDSMLPCSAGLVCSCKSHI